MMHRYLSVIILFILLIKESLASECTKRSFGESSFVCVCNGTNCHFAGASETTIDSTNVKVIKSSRDEFRNFEEILPRQDGTIKVTDVDFSIFVNPKERRQKMIGFGGSITDAASINIKSLSQEAQDNLLNMYFSKEGSRYNIIRVPIAGCDFSTHPYSYDDVEGDVDLVHFNLTVEDYQYKLPLIRQAIELCEEDLRILVSPWSPPAWMKTSKMFNGSGTLLPEMWQPYSNYLVKFFQMYEKNLGKKLWGFTPQNEPLSGLEPNWPFNCCGWTAEDMRDWIATVLGPTVSAAGYRRLKLLIDDYNRDTLPSYILPTVKDKTAAEYVDGISVHWYKDLEVGPEVLDETHEVAPDKFILYTEACVPSVEKPIALGSWERGERYIADIIEDLNHWSTGWIDWNLALDPKGGPNWARAKYDAAVIVNDTADEFYVQPLYFALSHFSRNVDRGATWISSSIDKETQDLKFTALENPNGQIIIIMANMAEVPYQIGIADQNKQYIFKYNIEGKSWLTITYKK